MSPSADYVGLVDRQVHAWPAGDSRPAVGILVLRWRSEPTREFAREQLRLALRTTAGDAIADRLSSAPRGESRDSLPVSTSHDGTLSMAAWSLDERTAIGVDVLQPAAFAGWDAAERTAFETLYLGDARNAGHAGVAAVEAGGAGAGAGAGAGGRSSGAGRGHGHEQDLAARWCAHEARLKCLGLGLQEWSMALQRRLAATRAKPIPAGWLEPARIAFLAWQG